MAITLERIKIQPIKIDKNKSFEVLILDVEPYKNSFSGKILGRDLKYWVKFACRDLPSRIIEYDNASNVLEFVGSYINTKFDYTIVLFSKTPLLEVGDIESLKDFAIYKQINLCKLPAGYIVSNKYLVENTTWSVDSVYANATDNFYIVENKKQYKYALEVLQDRINNFHMDNGVEITKPSSVYIEPEVDIERGVIIYPSVSLKGSTTIGMDTIIKDNAVIVDSVIGDKCFIGGANIEKTKIENMACIGSFCNIIESSIGAETIIDAGCNIVKAKIKSKEKINANSNIGEINDSSSGTR